MTKTKEKKNIPKGWSEVAFEDVMNFERPDNYIVKSAVYSDTAKTPVLTANKSFVLGYTDEDFGVYESTPAVIFDDFTTDSKFVDFPFKIKSSAIKILKSKDEKKANLKFLHEVMSSIKFPVGNHKRYYISQYQKQNIWLPPLKEQQKIAEVLGAVDEEIEKTKEVIKVTEKLKKGLMQHLFTRGIGHTKFKQTELGEIPESWSVTTVRHSSLQLIDGDRGTNYPKRNDFLDEGYCLFLSAKNVTKGGFVFDELSFITKEKDETLRKGKLERGDIILTSRGTVGNVAIYDESVRYEHIRINSGMLIFRHGKDFIPEFLYWYLTSPQMQSAFKKMGSGSAQPQLPVGSLELIPVLVIPKEEQEKISEMISSVHKKISVNKKLLAKQTELKKGLMQDLLSGAKRITV